MLLQEALEEGGPDVDASLAEAVGDLWDRPLPAPSTTPEPPAAAAHPAVIDTALPPPHDAAATAAAAGAGATAPAKPSPGAGGSGEVGVGPGAARMLHDAVQEPGVAASLAAEEEDLAGGWAEVAAEVAASLAAEWEDLIGGWAWVGGMPSGHRRWVAGGGWGAGGAGRVGALSKQRQEALLLTPLPQHPLSSRHTRCRRRRCRTGRPALAPHPRHRAREAAASGFRRRGGCGAAPWGGGGRGGYAVGQAAGIPRMCHAGAAAAAAAAGAAAAAQLLLRRQLLLLLLLQPTPRPPSGCPHSLCCCLPACRPNCLP